MWFLEPSWEGPHLLFDSLLRYRVDEREQMTLTQRLKDQRSEPWELDQLRDGLWGRVICSLNRLRYLS
jgi:hypothetical protein